MSPRDIPIRVLQIVYALGCTRHCAATFQGLNFLLGHKMDRTTRKDVAEAIELGMVGFELRESNGRRKKVLFLSKNARQFLKDVHHG